VATSIEAPPPPVTVIAAAKDPLTYRLGDLVLRLLCGLSGMAAYLALGLAAFAAACAAYAHWWIPFDTGSFTHQFVSLAACVLYYAAAPLLLLTCLCYLPWGLWRAAWERTSVFDEKRLHPAFVAVLTIAMMGVTYQAHMSLDGDWRQLPSRLTKVIDLPGTQTAAALLPERFVRADAPQSPASIAMPGEAGLGSVSSDAARLRVVQLAESNASRSRATERATPVQ
jgi:hypothetical protein